MSYGSNPFNLKEYENDERYNFIKGDITNYGLISEIIRDIDTIVNFAAQTHVDRSIADPWPFIHSNTLGVYNILESLRKNNKDALLLHIGTDEVYGDIAIGSFKESDSLRPSSPYSASKASADLLILSYVRTYGIKAIITRCTNNFGPYQFPEKLIPKAIIRAILGLKIPIYGKGKNVRDWIYVLDHCEALDLVLKKGRSGEIYNISSGNELSNLQIISKVLKIIGKPLDLIEFVEDRPGHDLRYSLDSSKIRSELGWKPKYSFEEALKKTVRWYINNENWWRPLAKDQVLNSTPWKLKW
jgi:dTDP-glucose 4,6-dehydratase